MAVLSRFVSPMRAAAGRSFNIYPCGLFIRVLINSTRLFFATTARARAGRVNQLLFCLAGERECRVGQMRVILVPKCYGLWKWPMELDRPQWKRRSRDVLWVTRAARTFILFTQSLVRTGTWIDSISAWNKLSKKYLDNQMGYCFSVRCDLRVLVIIYE